MTDEVRRYLRKAEHALEVAEDLLKDGHVPDAAYYAMYYAAQALLNADGIDVVKHSAVEAAFGCHFAKTGKICDCLEESANLRKKSYQQF